MPGATSTLSLPYPLLGDAADIEDFGVKDLADAVDPLLAATPAPVWRSCGDYWGVAANLTTASWWFSNSSGTAVVSGGSTSTGPQLWVPPVSGDVAVVGKTTRMRIRVSWLTNATAPAVNVSWGLFPITVASGGASFFTVTLGAAVITATQNAPGAGTGNEAKSASADMFSTVSSGTPYAVGVSANGTMNANSMITAKIQIEMRHT